jgi:methionyl-tRNA formyltransferase
MRREPIRVAALVNWGLGLELVKALGVLPEVRLGLVLGHCAGAPADPWRGVVREHCLARGIPYRAAAGVGPGDVAALLEAAGAELAVVHAWPARLPASVYGKPRLGMVNFHASLLPRHRGRSPHLAALAAGDRVTGLTCHHIDEGLDTGPIVAQASCPVAPDETPESLVEKIKTLAGPLLSLSVRRLLDPGFSPQPQPSCGPTPGREH